MSKHIRLAPAAMAEPITPLVNAAEIGRMLGVSARTVLSWHVQGRIPGLKIGERVVRFDINAVRAALEKQD
jgi:excisionase family DNA binding protein